MNKVDSLIWSWWGNRFYSRNKRDSLRLLYFGIFYPLISLLFTAYCYLPFKTFFLITIVGFSIAAIWIPIVEANKLVWPACINFVLAVSALIFSWHWGFSVFGFHLESYYCNVVSFAAACALGRRMWNVWIWKALDRIEKEILNNNTRINEECN